MTRRSPWCALQPNELVSLMGLSLSAGLRGPAAPTPPPKKTRAPRATAEVGKAKPTPGKAKPITSEPVDPLNIDRLAPPRLPVEGGNTQRPVERAKIAPEVLDILDAFGIKEVQWAFLQQGDRREPSPCSGWICNRFESTHQTSRSNIENEPRCVDCLIMEAWRDLRSAEWVKPSRQIDRKLDRKWEKNAFGTCCAASGGPANGLLIPMSEETPYKDPEDGKTVINRDLRTPRWVACDHEGRLWWQLPYEAETPADLPILTGLYEWVGTTYAWIGFGRVVVDTPAEDGDTDE